MYYQIDINGFYLGIQRESNEGMEFYTEVNPTGNFIRNRFDGEKWVEGATEEEIRATLPQEITRRQFKIALAVLGKNEQDILNGIDQLPEPSRTIARISYMEAGTFERYNPELIAVASMFLNMSEDDIDEVFKIGSQY
jgi:hypothetical protein